MIDATSTSIEDLPVATLAEARSDGDRVLPTRQKKPIYPMHCVTHSPKHPDCEICSRTMAQNAPTEQTTAQTTSTGGLHGRGHSPRGFCPEE
eukprot:4190158-Pyramimonas_sp.AAC.1